MLLVAKVRSQERVLIDTVLELLLRDLTFGHWLEVGLLKREPKLKIFRQLVTLYCISSIEASALLLIKSDFDVRRLSALPI